MKKTTKFRLLRISIILVFSVLAGRFWYVQVVRGAYYKAQGDISKIRLEPVPALRGVIFDRSGHQLVFNAPSWDVTVVPHGVPANGERVYRRLSQILHGHPTPDQIAQIVSSNMWHQYAPAIIKADVSFNTAMIIWQLHAQLSGIQANPTSARQYPAQDPQFSLSHILGYTGIINSAEYNRYHHLYPTDRYLPTDQTGQAGIEASLESYLHGVNGTAKVEVDSGERPVRTLNPGHPVPGDNVYLTIDWNLQQAVSRDLEAGLQQLGVRRGVAILENVHNGKILAMVSLPSYDNNLFSRGIRQKQYSALLNDPANPLFDQATAGTYPPGSIYKIITASAALQSGKISVNTTVDDTGSIKLCSVYDPASCQIYDGWKPGGLGEMNIVSAIALSSDIYFYTVAGGNPNDNPPPPYVGAAYIAKYAHLYGLGAPTGVDIPNEAAGFIPTPYWYDHSKPGLGTRLPGDTWHIGNTYNIAIGQGQDSVTPLQMVNVAATVANGGTVYEPRVVQKIVGRVIPRRGVVKRAETVQPFIPNPIRAGFVSPYNLSLIQQGMHHEVSNSFNTGTGLYAYDPRIDAAGKTGTSEAPGGADAWWMGYAPFNNPQVAVVVLIPNVNAEGAYAATPIGHKLLEDYFHLPPLKSNWLLDVQRKLLGSGGSQ